MRRLSTTLEIETAGIDAELTPPISILRPVRQTVPIIFCSAHSGRVYPKHFLAMSRLGPLTLRRSEDAFVDLLFQSAVNLGAPLLAARFPRAYLDVNREPNELDPRLIDGPLPANANTQSARVAGGLGIIPRIVADGEDIYQSRIPLSVAQLRISRLYVPFHNALAALIAEVHSEFGQVLLVDCHSMPSASVGTTPSQRPHFVIGDRFGTSCAQSITQFVLGTLTALGFEVHANRPYAGGFITEHYGRPQSGIHAVQIEINRALYLRESTLEPSVDFGPFTSVIETLIRALVRQSAAWRLPHVPRAAAE